MANDVKDKINLPTSLGAVVTFAILSFQIRKGQ